MKEINARGREGERETRFTQCERKTYALNFPVLVTVVIQV